MGYRRRGQGIPRGSVATTRRTKSTATAVALSQARDARPRARSEVASPSLACTQPGSLRRIGATAEAGRDRLAPSALLRPRLLSPVQVGLLCDAPASRDQSLEQRAALEVRVIVASTFIVVITSLMTLD